MTNFTNVHELHGCFQCCIARKFTKCDKNIRVAVTARSHSLSSFDVICGMIYYDQLWHNRPQKVYYKIP